MVASRLLRSSHQSAPRSICCLLQLVLLLCIRYRHLYILLKKKTASPLKRLNKTFCIHKMISYRASLNLVTAPRMSSDVIVQAAVVETLRIPRRRRCPSGYFAPGIFPLTLRTSHNSFSASVIIEEPCPAAPWNRCLRTTHCSLSGCPGRQASRSR